MKHIKLFLLSFWTTHIIAVHPDEKNADKYDSGDIQDFTKFFWEYKQIIREADTPVKLEAAYQDIRWLEQTYAGVVPESEHIAKIGELYKEYNHALNPEKFFES